MYGLARVKWGEHNTEDIRWYKSKEIYLDSKSFLFEPLGEEKFGQKVCEIKVEIKEN
jgi:hypothetical protein